MKRLARDNFSRLFLLFIGDEENKFYNDETVGFLAFHGATTLNIMTFNISTLSIMTLSIKTFSITINKMRHSAQGILKGEVSLYHWPPV